MSLFYVADLMLLLTWRFSFVYISTFVTSILEVCLFSLLIICTDCLHKYLFSLEVQELWYITVVASYVI